MHIDLNPIIPEFDSLRTAKHTWPDCYNAISAKTFKDNRRHMCPTREPCEPIKTTLSNDILDTTRSAIIKQ